MPADIIQLKNTRKDSAMRMVNEKVEALWAEAAAYRVKHRIHPDADTDWLEEAHRPLFLLTVAACAPDAFMEAGLEPYLDERGELSWRKAPN